MRGASVAFVLAISLSAGCAPLAISPPEPASRPLSAEPKPAVSYLALPVTVSSASLAAELDRRLSDETGENGIYFTENARTRIRGMKVHFGVHRSGPSSVSAVEGQLTYRVPLALNSGFYDWYRCAPGLGCRNAHGEFGGAGAISGKTDVAINEDWRLTSKTRFGFSWVDGPWIETDAQGEQKWRAPARQTVQRRPHPFRPQRSYSKTRAASRPSSIRQQNGRGSTVQEISFPTPRDRAAIISSRRSRNRDFSSAAFAAAKRPGSPWAASFRDEQGND